jgi:hypothetical protein
MEYYQQTHHVLSKGGRALAAWPNPEVHVHPPSCEAFTQHMDGPQRLHFHNFLATLFTAAHYNIMASHLRPLAHCMFASLVQYLSRRSSL